MNKKNFPRKNSLGFPTSIVKYKISREQRKKKEYKKCKKILKID